MTKKALGIFLTIVTLVILVLSGTTLYLYKQTNGNLFNPRISVDAETMEYIKRMQQDTLYQEKKEEYEAKLMGFSENVFTNLQTASFHAEDESTSLKDFYETASSATDSIVITNLRNFKGQVFVTYEDSVIKVPEGKRMYARQFMKKYYDINGYRIQGNFFHTIQFMIDKDSKEIITITSVGTKPYFLQGNKFIYEFNKEEVTYNQLSANEIEVNFRFKLTVEKDQVKEEFMLEDKFIYMYEKVPFE